MEILCYICYISAWCAVIPAIYRILKRKSSTDYSKQTMVMNFTYNLIWLIYVMSNPAIELVICAIIDLILSLLYLIVVFKYYKK